jgi:hypothetical protein
MATGLDGIGLPLTCPETDSLFGKQIPVLQIVVFDRF